MKTLGYAAQSATSPLEPFTFQRRALRPNDIVMEILYCGICHTDLHQARNDWVSLSKSVSRFRGRAAPRPSALVAVLTRIDDTTDGDGILQPWVA